MLLQPLFPTPGADVAQNVSRLRDEFGAELAADPPDQPALAGPALREDERKLRRDFDMFGDDLDAAIRDVRDHAIARQ